MSAPITPTPHPSGAHRPTDWPAASVVGHRGLAGLAPENTLSALREAAAAGAEGAEFDIRRTADGKIVLLHDDKLDRTTDGEGLLANATWETVSKLDAGSWKDPKWAGERLPSLPEALRLLAGTSTRPVVEVKEQGLEDGLLEALRAEQMLERSAAISFFDDVVANLRKREPKLVVGWLYGKKLEGKPAEQAEFIAAKALSLGTALVDLEQKLLSPALIDLLHARGIVVWAWTVNEPARMAELIRWGVDSITTDRPDIAVRVRAETLAPPKPGPGTLPPTT